MPPIARLTNFGYGRRSPAVRWWRIAWACLAGRSWASASKFEREIAPTADSDLASGFAHLIYTPSPGVESRTLAWVQRTSVPFAYRRLFGPDASTRDRAVHLQSVLDRRLERLQWRVDGGYTERFRENDTAGLSAITADRLTDGPIASIAAATGRSVGGPLDTERPHAAQTASRSEASDRGRREPRANVRCVLGSVHREHRANSWIARRLECGSSHTPTPQHGATRPQWLCLRPIESSSLPY